MSTQDWRTLAAGLGISAVGLVALAGIAFTAYHVIFTWRVF